MIIFTITTTAPSSSGVLQITLDSLGAILSISICLLILRVKLFGGASREIKTPELSEWHANSRPISTTARTATEEEANNPNLDLPLLSPVGSLLSERRPHSQEIVRDHEADA